MTHLGVRSFPIAADLNARGALKVPRKAGPDRFRRHGSWTLAMSAVRIQGLRSGVGRGALDFRHVVTPSYSIPIKVAYRLTITYGGPPNFPEKSQRGLQFSKAR